MSRLLQPLSRYLHHHRFPAGAGCYHTLIGCREGGLVVDIGKVLLDRRLSNAGQYS